MLRPGGRLVLADIFFTSQYVRQLRELGWTDVTRRNLGWRMWGARPWDARSHRNEAGLD